MYGISVIAFVVVGSAMIDSHYATKVTTAKPIVYTANDCLKCHSDSQGVKMMQRKAGNPHYMEQAAKLYRELHKSANAQPTLVATQNSN